LNIPVPGLIVATPVLLLIHDTAGAEALVSVALVPTHVTNVPVIEAGFGFTVYIVVAAQPVGNVYEMITVPADTAVTTPDVLIVAMPVFRLLQLPPAVPSVNVVVKPTHAFFMPLIAAGSGFTVR
jgi:hypothetical protein